MEPAFKSYPAAAGPAPRPTNPCYPDSASHLGPQGLSSPDIVLSALPMTSQKRSSSRRSSSNDYDAAADLVSADEKIATIIAQTDERQFPRKAPESYIGTYHRYDWYFDAKGNNADLHGRLVDAGYDALRHTALHIESIIDRTAASLQRSLSLPRFHGRPGTPSRPYLVLAQFKAGRMDVFYVRNDLIDAGFQFCVGDLVIVEADRGEDLGKIVKLDVSLDEAKCLKLKYHQSQQMASNAKFQFNSTVCNGNRMHLDLSAMPQTMPFPKEVFRLAKPSEVVQLSVKEKDELKSLKITELKVAARNLDISIVDTEYQWDFKKLTIYYYSERRVDFRELVKELFRLYKTRIWLCHVDGGPKVQEVDYKGLDEYLSLDDKPVEQSYVYEKSRPSSISYLPPQRSFEPAVFQNTPATINMADLSLFGVNQTPLPSKYSVWNEKPVFSTSPDSISPRMVPEPQFFPMVSPPSAGLTERLGAQSSERMPSGTERLASGTHRRGSSVTKPQEFW